MFRPVLQFYFAGMVAEPVAVAFRKARPRHPTHHGGRVVIIAVGFTVLERVFRFPPPPVLALLRVLFGLRHLLYAKTINCAFA